MAAYNLIATTTASTDVVSIVFSSIPQTFTDLLVVTSIRLDYGATSSSLGLFLNTAASDTSYRVLQGNGSATSSSNNSGQTDFYLGEVNANSSTASVFSSGQVYIPNYTGSTQKSMSSDNCSENNAATSFQNLNAGLCTKTAAVTSITIRGFGGGSGNIRQYSSASLYGIKNS